VQGYFNRLYIDGVLIGSHASGAVLCNRVDLQVGLATQDAFTAFDDLRVTSSGLTSLGVTIGAEATESSGISPGATVAELHPLRQVP
jgi:hypothetical protein